MQLITLPTESTHSVVNRLWVDPAGRELLALLGHHGGAGRLVGWDLPAGRVIERRTVVNDREHDVGVPWPAFDPALRFMAFDRHVEDRRTGQRVRLRGGTARAFSPDGATAYIPAGIIPPGGIYRVDRYDLRAAFAVGAAEVAPDADGSLRLPKGVSASDLAVSPAGDLLAARTADGDRLIPFRLPGGERLRSVSLPRFKTDGVRYMFAPFGRLAVSPDGRAVASAADGVCLWPDVGRRTVLALDERHFADLAFTPDGARLVGVRADAAVVWDAADGGAVARLDFRQQCGPLGAVAVAPDGLTAFAGGTKGRLVRWDL